MRGIRTLAVRTTHQAASALHIAEALVDHPAVSVVHYPGLITHPQFDLAKRQMRNGGTVLAIELAGGRPAAERFLESVQLTRVATSLGGPETLGVPPGHLDARQPDARRGRGDGRQRRAAAHLGRSRRPG